MKKSEFISLRAERIYNAINNSGPVKPPGGYHKIAVKQCHNRPYL